MNDELATFKRERERESRVGPRSLIMSGALVAGAMGATAIMFAASQRLKYHDIEPVPARSCRVARGVGGIGAAGVGVALGGAGWLIARNRERRARAPDAAFQSLQHERKQPELFLEPQLGPGTAGLALSGAF